MSLPKTLLLALGALSVVFVPVPAAQSRGPSSSQDPYMLPVAPGVRTISILTAGDSPAGSDYPMVGLPDGLGVFRRRVGSFTLLVNHELSSTQGIVRDHGRRGAFVSRWTIRASNLSVVSGSDLIQNVVTTSGGDTLSRFCSGDLPSRSALYPRDPRAPLVYMNGEESGTGGRAFAHVASGPNQGLSTELPGLGKYAHENVVARPFPSAITLVGSTDDSTPGQVYFYVGAKRNSGDELERAGLTGGSLYGLKVPGVPLEDRETGLGDVQRFELAPLGDVSQLSGAELQAASVAAGVTEFLRPEDCAWDPRDPRRFYFATTDRYQSASQEGRSRLWRLTFFNPLRPELGGRIAMLLDGTEGQQMLDNIAVDRRGNLLLQEDTGGNEHLVRIWHYTQATDTLAPIAEVDPRFFQPGGSDFLTTDEETSGIVDAGNVLGPGWFLFTVQVHVPLGGGLVEGGQLLALFNPASQ